jgi:hypothetical protein
MISDYHKYTRNPRFVELKTLISDLQFERRAERRLLCSNLAQVCWIGPRGNPCTETGVLENVSKGGLGLCIHAEVRPEPGIEISIWANRVEFKGRVRQCDVRENGHLVGLRLEVPCEKVDGVGLEHLLDVTQFDLG